MQLKPSLILLGLASAVQARSEFNGAYKGNLTAQFEQGQVLYNAYANASDGVLDVMLCRQTAYFKSQGTFADNWGFGSQAKLWFDGAPKARDGHQLVRAQFADFQACSVFPLAVAYWNTSAPGSFQVTLTPDCRDPAYESLSLELVPAADGQIPKDCGAYEMNDVSYAVPIIAVMLTASVGLTWAIARNNARLAAQDEKQQRMVDPISAERNTSEPAPGQ